jgi:5'-3' exonuclease
MIITPQTFNYVFKYHYSNVGLIKIIAGDKSDNISGIKNVGEDTVFTLFPEIKTEKKDIEWLLERADVLSKEKNLKSLKNILEGETKWGTWGKEYYSIMDKVINLNNPYMSEESEEYIKSYITEPLDPEGREGLPAIQKMLIEDEIYNMLPKNDNDYFTFWKSFITIINKEKNIFYDRIKQ